MQVVVERPRAARRSGVSGESTGDASIGDDEKDAEETADGTTDQDDEQSQINVDVDTADGDEDIIKALDFHFVSLDGKVFPVETPRVSHLAGRAVWSNKVSASGVQTLVWSTPCGLPLLVTGLFAGKLSEKRQVAMHSGWLAAIPKGVDILQDRGFRNLQRYYPKYVTLSAASSRDLVSLFHGHECHADTCSRNRPVIPAATNWVRGVALRISALVTVLILSTVCVQGRFQQLDDDEYVCSAEQARHRWTAEAIFGEVTNAPALKGVIPRHFMPYLDVAHTLAYLRVYFRSKFFVEARGWQEALAALTAEFHSATTSSQSLVTN